MAVSDIAPKEGTILFTPLGREVISYYMLKPFFDENDQLVLDSSLPGAFPGKAQEFNEDTHPELNLRGLMVLIPRVEPGDMVFWHCDLIHAVDAVHEGKADSSVFYIPSVPLCQANIEYSFLQREAFLRGLVGPDFPGFPNDLTEQNHKGRANLSTVENTGGKRAMREFALDKFLEEESHTEGAKIAIRKANDLLFVD